MEYFELGARTYYSFLDATASPEEVIRRAHALGYQGIAITDFAGVYGLPKAWGEARKLETFKMISGADLEILYDTEQRLTVSILARSRKGYGALCRLFTVSHAQTAVKGKAQISCSQFDDFVCSYPGIYECVFIAHPCEAMETWEDRFRGLKSKAAPGLLEVLRWFYKKCTPHGYISFQRRLDGFDEVRCQLLERIKHDLPIKEVIVHRPRMLEREDQKLREVVNSIRAQEDLEHLGSYVPSSPHAEMKTLEQLKSLYLDRRESLARTSEIARLCDFKLSELTYHYPTEWVPKSYTSDEYLRKLCHEGMTRRYSSSTQDDVLKRNFKQLEYELKLVQELKFADYFLTVYDIVDFARKKGILCQGRGSAANSVICYVLGITAIDPLAMNMLFERFISVERGEPPDIDVDFEHDRREEVIQYIYDKYGRDRAAMVSAVVTFRERSAFREVAKSVGLDVGTLSARKLRNHLKTSLDPEINYKHVQAESLSNALDAMPRHLSIHSGGFFVSHDPVIEMVPVEPATMEGRTVIQWDKYDLDILGLLKIDVLSLGMLSALQRCLKLVDMELHQIPPDDKATYDMICKADTIGTFQIESRAQMSMLPRLRPRNFYDLVIEVALVRPGPIVGNMVHPYLKRRRGLEKFKLPDARLEPILGRTLGVPIFQEQIMKMAIVLGGFTPGESDQLRRAIGAWRSSGSIDVMGKRLYDGLIREGLPKSFAADIFEQIKGFSEYGFPESHAASFALLAYASCYLKCHYPAQFLVAMLNSQPLGFYEPHTLIDDASRHGVNVLPVDVCVSSCEAQMEGESVRLGFQSVYGMKTEEMNLIEHARGGAQFQSIHDFRARTNISIKALRSLAMGDAFRTLGYSRRDALWQVLTFELSLAGAVKKDLFTPSLFSKLSQAENIALDYQVYGASTLGHPMKSLRQVLGDLGDITSIKAKSFKHKSVITIAGMAIVMQRPPTAKGTAFATLEDEDGFLDLILWKDVYEKSREVLRDGGLVCVTGQIQRDGLSVSMLVSSINSITLSGSNPVRNLHPSVSRSF